MKKVEDLKLLLIDNNNPQIQLEKYSASAFELWTEVWKRTFRDLRVHAELNSDDFMDREMFGLFYGTEPAGLIFHRTFDLNRKHDLRHSYFNNYPPEVIDKIKNQGHSKVIVSGYRTVNPEWRQAVTDLPVFEILVGAEIKYFQESSNSTAMLSYSRRDKKMHESRYRHGGKALLEDAIAYNVGVDFSITTKEDAKQSDLPGVANAVEALWSNHKGLRILKAG